MIGTPGNLVLLRYGGGEVTSYNNQGLNSYINSYVDANTSATTNTGETVSLNISGVNYNFVYSGLTVNGYPIFSSGSNSYIIQS